MIFDLSREVRLIPKRGLTKDLINGFSILNGPNYFVEDVFQKVLLFKSVYKYFKVHTKSSRILAWKSKGLLEGSIFS